MVTIDRVQTGVRIERRILKTAKALAEALDIPLGELLEGVLLHSFEGKAPFSEAIIHKIEALKSVYDLDLTSADAHHLDEPSADDELEDFYAGRIRTAGFAHGDHLRMAFLALNRDSFPVAFERYSEGIRRLAVHAGRPEKYNQTITGAFLSVIAERLSEHPQTDFGVFIEANPDLLDKALLDQYYTPERLASAQAKSIYLLPDRS
ncbi:hypothetical protein [Diaminobutyricibacter sp. McL0608]|uniref:hypothetical protein n=1 Tax=Leifsonia sp. McL0608 TaxID=3143537 RepID=UPI0031F2FFE7